jgi:polysaccharide pyruvyl transferase WcaK-like protein
MMRLHIGHHFFGSGNIGDDYMLAGFLALADRALPGARLTCCTPFDRASQERRLSQVEWLEYTDAARDQAIAACDAWIGVGDSPFQSEVGSWFLDHLLAERDRCRRSGTPMYFFCVGVNDVGAMENPATRAIVESAAKIWTRDEQSARLLRSFVGPDRVASGPDLANVFFARRRFGGPEPGTIGFVLNFEDRAAFAAGALCEVIDRVGRQSALRWCVQEVRTLSGSEWELLASLPASHRERLDVRAPDYATASLDDLAACWGVPETLVTSRYHGALFGAWAGSRVVVIERNAKLTGIVDQLGLVSVGDLRSPGPLIEAMRTATGVDRERLAALASRVEECGRELALCIRGAGSGVRDPGSGVRDPETL